MVGSKFGTNSMILWTNLPFVNSPGFVQVDGDGVMICRMFSWHSLGPLKLISHCLNVTDYLSIVAVGDRVHPFMSTIYSSSNSFQHNNALSQTRLKLRS